MPWLGQELWPRSLQLCSSIRQHGLAASVVAGNAAMVAMAWRKAMTLLEAGVSKLLVFQGTNGKKTIDFGGFLWRNPDLLMSLK